MTRTVVRSWRKPEFASVRPAPLPKIAARVSALGARGETAIDLRDACAAGHEGSSVRPRAWRPFAADGDGVGAQTGANPWAAMVGQVRAGRHARHLNMCLAAGGDQHRREPLEDPAGVVPFELST
jgi:hypothetical protein